MNIIKDNRPYLIYPIQKIISLIFLNDQQIESLKIKKVKF